MYPKTFKRLIEHFASLPSVGPKMAERLVLYLFKQDAGRIADFSATLADIKNLRSCTACFNIAEADLCEICSDSGRDRSALCVVEEPLDIIAIEKTRTFTGLYHVLGGLIYNDDKGQEVRIPELLARVKSEGIKEIIIATNPTTEGDATSLYLKRKLEPLGIRVTRLARGLSTGGDIEYADEATLSSALANRKEL